MRKNIFPLVVLVMILSMGLTSCEAIGDLIEFGVWVGVIIVVAVLALVYWIYRKFKR